LAAAIALQRIIARPDFRSRACCFHCANLRRSPMRAYALMVNNTHNDGTKLIALLAARL